MEILVFQPSAVLFQAGPFVVRWYGLLIVLGILAAGWVAARQARHFGENPEMVWNGILYCVIAGLIGGRLYHVISAWEYYAANPSQIWAIWQGGLGIFGAISLGALALLVYTILNRLNFVQWADFAAPGVLLAQAIGRWGNFFNQELYGRPSDMPFPFSIAIDQAHRLPGYETFERFHPLFLYESVWNLLGFVVLVIIARRFANRLFVGDVALFYGLWYPAGRFFLEPLRLDSWTILGIPTAQWVSGGVFLVCAALLIYRHTAVGGVTLAAAKPSSASPAEQPKKKGRKVKA